jgi:tripartite-type tricarboxylate transporter receptor subunit TctC
VVLLSALSTTSALLIIGGGAAQAAEEFFKSKTINLIVAAGAGGGFDIVARLAAEHLGRFLPGHPTIVPQNMPGANGIRAAEFLARVAPRDGLTIGLLQPLLVLNKALDPSAPYEPQQLTWIGRVNPSPTFGVTWHTAPVHSIGEATNTKVALAAGDPLGPAWMVPLALNRLIGTKFVPIKGYPSANEQGLAMESGEVEGMGSASEEYLSDRGWLEQKLVNVIYTIGRERRPIAPETPTVVELMKNDRDRNVMKLLTSAAEIGRAFAAPPEIPPAIADMLRDGFGRMLQDPGLVADARQRGVDIEPLAPALLKDLATEAVGIPKDVVEETRAAIQ